MPVTVSHATSTQPLLHFNAPALECAITSHLLGVISSRLHWTINSGKGHSWVPIGPVPHCRVEGVWVQKTPHLLLDVPQVLPAKRHPGRITEEAVQALETEGEGIKGGEENVTWGSLYHKPIISLIHLIVRHSSILFMDSMNEHSTPLLSEQKPRPLILLCF